MSAGQLQSQITQPCLGNDLASRGCHKIRSRERVKRIRLPDVWCSWGSRCEHLPQIISGDDACLTVETRPNTQPSDSKCPHDLAAVTGREGFEERLVDVL